MPQISGTPAQLGSRLLDAIQKPTPTRNLQCILLITSGADLTVREEDGGWTALMHAVRQSIVPIVTAILEKKPDLSVTDNTGRTVRDIAEKYATEEVKKIVRTAVEVQRLGEEEAKLRAIDHRAHKGADEEIKSAPMPRIKKKPFRPGAGP